MNGFSGGLAQPSYADCSGGGRWLAGYALCCCSNLGLKCSRGDGLGTAKSKVEISLSIVWDTKRDSVTAGLALLSRVGERRIAFYVLLQIKRNLLVTVLMGEHGGQSRKLNDVWLSAYDTCSNAILLQHEPRTIAPKKEK